MKSKPVFAGASNAFFAKDTPGGRLLKRLSKPIESWDFELMRHVLEVTERDWNRFNAEEEKSDWLHELTYWTDRATDSIDALPIRLEPREMKCVKSLLDLTPLPMNQKPEFDSLSDPELPFWHLETPVLASPGKIAGILIEDRGRKRKSTLVLPEALAKKVAKLSPYSRLVFMNDWFARLVPFNNKGEVYRAVGLLSGRSVESVVRLNIRPIIFEHQPPEVLCGKLEIWVSFRGENQNLPSDFFWKVSVTSLASKCYQKFRDELMGLVQSHGAKRTTEVSPLPPQAKATNAKTAVTAKNTDGQKVRKVQAKNKAIKQSDNGANKIECPDGDPKVVFGGTVTPLSEAQRAFLVTLMELNVPNRKTVFGNVVIRSEVAERVQAGRFPRFISFDVQKASPNMRDIMGKKLSKIIEAVSYKDGRPGEKRYRIFQHLEFSLPKVSGDTDPDSR